MTMSNGSRVLRQATTALLQRVDSRAPLQHIDLRRSDRAHPRHRRLKMNEIGKRLDADQVTPPPVERLAPAGYLRSAQHMPRQSRPLLVAQQDADQSIPSNDRSLQRCVAEVDSTDISSPWTWHKTPTQS